MVCIITPKAWSLTLATAKHSLVLPLSDHICTDVWALASSFTLLCCIPWTSPPTHLYSLLSLHLFMTFSSSLCPVAEKMNTQQRFGKRIMSCLNVFHFVVENFTPNHFHILFPAAAVVVLFLWCCFYDVVQFDGWTEYKHEAGNNCWHIYHHIIYVDKQNNYISLYMYIMYMKWMFKIRINPGSIHNNIFFQFSIFFSISNFYHIIALH